MDFYENCLKRERSIYLDEAIKSGAGVKFAALFQYMKNFSG